MKILELKDIKCYLGTGLKWTLQGLKTFTMSGLSEETLYTEEGSVFNWLKHEDLPQALFPFFLPLSALTEQLPDGSIPIIVLAGMAHPSLRWSLKNDYVICYSNGFSFKYNTGLFQFNDFGNYNQLALFEYLYQNHFWLGDQSLFETGEIIDKRSLR